MVMLLTFLITLILGIDKGIIAGVAISLVVLIRTTAKPKVRCVDLTRGGGGRV
jgi:MFS superfamily sulfate permease-like transporter